MPSTGQPHRGIPQRMGSRPNRATQVQRMVIGLNRVNRPYPAMFPPSSQPPPEAAG